MKRDMDLARQIMLELEKSPYTGGWLHTSVEGHSQEEVNYHVMLLAKPGLVEAQEHETLSLSSVAEWLPISLNMEGHDFLEAAKNETIWRKAKKFIQDKGGALTFEVVKTVLAQVALKQVVS